MADITDTKPTDDLSALAWVHNELRRSLENANKALRRYLKESEPGARSDVDTVDPAPLRAARTQLHQGVGALELVGLPAAARLLRAAEAAVQRMVGKPDLVTEAAVHAIERASFALLDYLTRQLAGKPVSPVGLFPQYAAVQALAGADRVHPADLWEADFQWRELTVDPLASPRQADDAARSKMEAIVLRLMRRPDSLSWGKMAELCGELAAGARGRSVALWQLASAFSEAEAAGLLPSGDVHTKRVAARLLAQLRLSERKQDEPSERLAQDLLFFCAHARTADHALPRLDAVRRAWRLQDAVPVDYLNERLGRFDPAWIAQARKRLAGARDVWSALAGGEEHRLSGLGEQFALLSDSVQRLFPGGAGLAKALQDTAARVSSTGGTPDPALAMEVATSVLYLDATLEDGELDQPELEPRVRRMAQRINDLRDGGEPQPLEPWMEELYRRVSDRQTMGSVVQELRASLSEVEKQIDQYFRNPSQRELLIPVPGQLSAMRGVLSVLGMDQASQAVLHMRDDVDALANTEVDPQLAIRAGTFDRLADNLGALSFLIDMLGVQPQLAKSLFRFDPVEGTLSAVMGQSERVSAFGGLDADSSSGAPLVDEALALADSVAAEPSADHRQALEALTQKALAADLPGVAGAVVSAQRALERAGDEQARQAVSAELAQTVGELVKPVAPPPPPPPAPLPAEGADLEDDAEMREIFLEEAREVIDAARASLEQLAGNPEDVGELTTVRRSFHTLKGSSRMVGLREFGEAAWACEQLYNARLAQHPRLDGDLGRFTHEVLDHLAAWVDAIADGRAAGFQAAPVVAAADSLRLEGRMQPIAAVSAPAEAAAPAEVATVALGSGVLEPLHLDLPEPESAPLAEPAPEPLAAAAVPPAELPVLELPVPDVSEVEPAAPEVPQLPVVDVVEAPAAPDFALDLGDTVPAAIESLDTRSGMADTEPMPLPAVTESLTERVPGLPAAADLDLNFGLAPAGPTAAAEPVVDQVPAAPGEPEPEFDFDIGTGTVPLPDPLRLDEPEAAPAEAPPVPAPEAALPVADLAEVVEIDLDALDLDMAAPVTPAAAPAPEVPALVPAPVPEATESLLPAAPSLEEPVLDLSMPLTEAPVAEAAAPVDFDFDLSDAADAALAQPVVAEPLHAAAVPVEVPTDVPASEPDLMLPALEAVAAEALPLPADAVTEPPLVDVPAVDLPAIDLPVAEAPVAEPEPQPVAEVEPDDQVKVIGPLRIPIPLFNIYLNEADELSRRLSTELAEWAVEHDRRGPGESTVVLAHSLAGNSATVGFADLSALSRALEHALIRAAGLGAGLGEEALLFNETAEEIRRLLHQFAAGFLKPMAPGLIERLAAAERRLADLATARAQAADTVPPASLEEALEAAAESGLMPLVPLGATASFAALEALPEAEPTPVRAARADAFDDDEDIEAVDAIDEDLFPIFEEESEELLPQLQSRLRDWMLNPSDADAAAACMRTLHTFKGGARLAGAMRLGEMAHRLETAIEHLSAAPEASQIERLIGRADALVGGFEAQRKTKAAAPVAPVPVAQPVPVELPPVEPVEAATGTEAPVDAALPVAALPSIDWTRFTGRQAEQAQAAERAGTSASTAVRVRAGLLDRLVNHAGEVSITRARIDSDVTQLQSAVNDLTDNLDRLRSQLREIELQAETQIASRMEAVKSSAEGFDPLEMDRFTRFQELTRMMAESVNDVATVQRSVQRTLQSTEDQLAAQARLTRELQDDLLRTRMVEFESLADRLYRVVRQASKDTGKQVRLDIVGGSIEVDRGVLERMIGPLEHLLRNSVAHGIEADRAAAGKDASGAIRITVTQEGNEVGVECRDDGAGLNLARIRQRAEERGLVQPGHVASDAELANLIFLPGFSTASEVTELAGRGVGLDVVRAEVNAMGGRIETASSPGQGTSFRLVLPLTTAVTQVVLLRCGELQVAVPSTLIEVVRRVPTAQVEQAYASGSLPMGDQSVPFFWLGGLLQHSARGPDSGRSQAVVVVRSAAQRVALHVDDVLGNQEVVVKHVGPQLSRLPGLAGVTLLPSGGVALIYNPVALAALYGEAALRRAATQSAAEAPQQPVPAQATEAAQAPLVLVVDDSLTVRRVTQRLLQREGYRVALAKDGLDAIEKLAEERPAIMLSDIEMPRMDGFDLVRNVRADARLAGLPVIMITSRIAQKHRDYAAELGVDHYLGKPYSEDELLKLVGRYTGTAVATA